MRKGSYQYAARAEWIEGKRVKLMIGGHLDVEVSTPPEFGGPKGFLSPGELFVASACACFATTFFAVAEGARLSYGDFTCAAKGSVEELNGKGVRFTKIDFYPELTIGDDEEEEWAERVLEMSKRNCLVANSMACEVMVNPTIHAKGEQPNPRP